jgi:hypothetical protein
MSRVRTGLALPAAAALIVAGVIACGSSTDSNGPNCLNTIVGTFALDSIEFVGQGPVIKNPDATGTFTAFDDTLYAVHITITGQGATNDSGHYCVTNTGHIVQDSYLLPVQLTGTATLTGTKLAVNATGAGVTVNTWATKQ